MKTSMFKQYVGAAVAVVCLLAGTAVAQEVVKEWNCGAISNAGGAASVHGIGINRHSIQDRNVPQIKPDEGVAVIVQLTPISFELSVGPNPVQKSDGVMKIFASGKSFVSGTLTIYDATGNVVRKINVGDDGAIQTAGGYGIRPYDGDRCQIAEWDLRDARGRLVSAGTYLVRGTVTVNGKAERVSAVLGVR